MDKINCHTSIQFFNTLKEKGREILANTELCSGLTFGSELTDNSRQGSLIICGTRKRNWVDSMQGKGLTCSIPSLASVITFYCHLKILHLEESSTVSRKIELVSTILTHNDLVLCS